MNETTKRCPNCGTEFQTSDKRKIYCSNECCNESTNQRKMAYDRLYRNGCDDYIGKEIFMSEFDRGKKPTVDEILDVKSTLRDFGCDPSINIPDFDTYAQLDAWKIDMIDSILS